MNSVKDDKMSWAGLPSSALFVRKDLENGSFSVMKAIVDELGSCACSLYLPLLATEGRPR